MKEEKTGSWWTGLLYFLFIQSPFETIFGIFDFEPECCQRVANLVGCRPVFIGFCFHTLFQQHIYYFPVCRFTAIGRTFLLFQSHNVKTEQMESLFQIFQVFGRDCGIAGNDIIYDTGTFEKLCDDDRSCLLYTSDAADE